IELERADLAALPTPELNAEFAQCVAQVAIVSDSGPLSNQAFEPLWNVLHSSTVCLPSAFIRRPRAQSPEPNAPRYRFLNSSGMPPWMLPVTPLIVLPSAESSPAKFH